MIALLLCIAAIILLVGSYYAYRIAFFSPEKGRDQVNRPTDPQYDPHRPEMRRIFQQLSERPYEEVSIYSHDGL